MTSRLPLSSKRYETILNAYAPTITNPNEVKDKFHDYIDSVISATLRKDILILLVECQSVHRPPKLGRNDCN